MRGCGFSVSRANATTSHPDKVTRTINDKASRFMLISITAGASTYECQCWNSLITRILGTENTSVAVKRDWHS